MFTTFPIGFRCWSMTFLFIKLIGSETMFSPQTIKQDGPYKLVTIPRRFIILPNKRAQSTDLYKIKIYKMLIKQIYTKV